MSNQRVILVFADTLDAAEALKQAVTMAQANPWKPNPPGVPFGSPQERYSDEATGTMILQRLREAAPALSIEAVVIVP